MATFPTSLPALAIADMFVLSRHFNSNVRTKKCKWFESRAISLNVRASFWETVIRYLRGWPLTQPSPWRSWGWGFPRRKVLYCMYGRRAEGLPYPPLRKIDLAQNSKSRSTETSYTFRQHTPPQGALTGLPQRIFRIMQQHCIKF